MYSESKDQYPTRGFSHLNPQLAADIVSLGHSTGHAATYRGNMITDATVSSSTSLRVLDTNKVTSSSLKPGMLKAANVKWRFDSVKRTLTSDVPPLELKVVTDNECSYGNMIKLDVSFEPQLITLFSCSRHWISKEDYYVGSRLQYISSAFSQLAKNRRAFQSAPSSWSSLLELAESIVSLLDAPAALLGTGDVDKVADLLMNLSDFQTSSFVTIENSLIIDTFFDKVAPDWTLGKLPAEMSRNFFLLKKLNQLVRKSSVQNLQFKK